MHGSQFNPSDVTLSHQYRVSFSGKYHTYVLSVVWLISGFSCRNMFPVYYNNDVSFVPGQIPGLNFPQLAHDSCSW